VGEPGQGRVGALRQGAHPQGPVGGLGQHRQGEVVEVAQARVPPQLGVEHPGQQLDDTDEAQPGVPLLRVEPPGLHDLIIEV
jgi:hypothetical protein